MKILRPSRMCEVEGCGYVWMEEIHNYDDHTCEMCGRDICTTHLKEFKVQLPLSPALEPRTLSIGKVCNDCINDILCAERDDLLDALRPLSSRVRFPWNLRRGDRVIWKDPAGPARTKISEDLVIKWIAYQAVGADDCVISIVHEEGELECLPHELEEVSGKQ